jgi:hypothetical protein
MADNTCCRRVVSFMTSKTGNLVSKGPRTSRDVISYLTHETSSRFYRVLPPKREAFLSLFLSVVLALLPFLCFHLRDQHSFDVIIQSKNSNCRRTLHIPEQNVKGHFNSICCFLWFAHVAKKKNM